MFDIDDEMEWRRHAAVNGVCVNLGKLAKDERYTEAERALFWIAWHAASDAQNRVYVRTRKSEAAE